MNKRNFGECTDCRKWAEVPKGFSEKYHFIQCPVCKKPMYLSHNMDPIRELGLRESNKVEAGLMSQKGY